MDVNPFISKDTTFPPQPASYDGNYVAYYAKGPRHHEYLREMNRDSATLRDFLFGHAPAGFVATSKSVGHRLKAHVDEPVRSGERTLILRTRQDRVGTMNYFVYAQS